VQENVVLHQVCIVILKVFYSLQKLFIKKHKLKSKIVNIK